MLRSGPALLPRGLRSERECAVAANTNKEDQPYLQW
jgi:hypothetical protein